MRKLFFIFNIILFASCGQSADGYESGDEPLTETENVLSASIKFVELEHRGDIHEYVYYAAGYGKSLAHWEGCKYCKHSKVE